MACPSTYLHARLAGDVVHAWRDGRLLSHVQPVV